jgi:hypothetical protein
MHELETAPDAAVARAEAWAEGNPDDYDYFNMFAWESAQRDLHLGKAEDFANRALFARGTTVQERANALDTKAEIMLRSKRPDMAVTFSREAVNMLDKDKDKKLRKELETNLAKYEKAFNDMPAAERAVLLENERKNR